MKLVICIVQDQDSHILTDDLTDSDIRFTRLASTGGFLKAGNTTLLIGVEDELVDEVMRVIRRNCETREVTTTYMPMNMTTDTYMPYPMNVTVGGATVFIVDVDQHIRL